MSMTFLCSPHSLLAVEIVLVYIHKLLGKAIENEFVLHHKAQRSLDTNQYNCNPVAYYLQLSHVTYILYTSQSRVSSILTILLGTIFIVLTTITTCALFSSSHLSFRLEYKLI